MRSTGPLTGRLKPFSQLPTINSERNSGKPSWHGSDDEEGDEEESEDDDGDVKEGDGTKSEGEGETEEREKKDGRNEDEERVNEEDEGVAAMVRDDEGGNAPIRSPPTDTRCGMRQVDI